MEKIEDREQTIRELETVVEDYASWFRKNRWVASSAAVPKLDTANYILDKDEQIGRRVVMKRLRETGMTLEKIGQIFGVTKQRTDQILKGK